MGVVPDDVSDAAVTQATFCATLVDEWARAGLRLAVLAPGSRSTPLALALTSDPRFDVQVHHDERCAGFVALGAGLATGVPAVVLCTSGTAATHLHGAVVEAHHAGVPLVVVTADRPPELRDVGAPQTIDQSHLYGRAVRWFFDPGPADEAMRSAWRSIAARAVLEAASGPVHLNLPFREPLVAEPAPLPAGRDGGEPWTRRSRAVPAPADEGAPAGRRPLLVSTGRSGRWGTGVPVLGGGRSTAGANVVAHADALLRVPGLANELRPDVIGRAGAAPASRVVNEWLAASGAAEIALDHVPGLGASVAGGVAAPEAEAGWLERWLALDAAAEAAIEAVLADHPEPTEPATARTLLAALPASSELVVSSSMPIRDLEWYARPRADVTVHANRGANGIDGVLSTAIGIALAGGRPTACLLGDVAFLHDSNALIRIVDRGVNLTIVVVDNDGGGIFNFLPQAATLPTDRFELLFGTPHGVRPEALAGVHGIEAVAVETAADLAPALREATAGGGVRLIVARTDRVANVKLHDELHAAVADAVGHL
jgi:2-succinyl-5-enolpyruvyl-6-hydroxy-3-cyclohexene-1-carboxylate synthase